jgi:hypothetical protein
MRDSAAHHSVPGEARLLRGFFGKKLPFGYRPRSGH